MMRRPRRSRAGAGFVAFVTVCLQFCHATDAVAEDWRFVVRFSAAVRVAPFTGRVYLFFSRNRSEPRLDPDWFFPEQFIARDVQNWRPGETLTFSSGDRSILSYPRPLASLNLADEPAQAVARFNPFERQIGNAPGNAYSQIITVQQPAQSAEQPALVVDRLVPPKRFVETNSRKEFQIHSRLLSDFYGRDVRLSAAVYLPKSYQRDRRSNALSDALHGSRFWGDARHHSHAIPAGIERSGIPARGARPKLSARSSRFCRLGQ